MLGFPLPNRAHPTPVLGLSTDIGPQDNTPETTTLTVESVDSETSALIRAFLRPLFDQPDSWTELTEGLRAHGYGLAFRGGRLCLTDHATGERLCSLRFLGIRLRDLVAQLGRPIARALPGRSADGELVLCGSLAHDV